LGALWKLAALSGAGMLALALATPARADDQATPPPLMVAKTAVIAPDEPDATVSADAVTPETVSAPAPVPDPAPVRVVATPGWKLAAKPGVVHHAAPVRTQQTTPQPVISTRTPPVRAARTHHAAKHVRSARAPTHTGWYQVTKAQYRQARGDSPGGRPSLAAAAAQQPAVVVAPARPALSQKVRTICELRLRKCLQFCSQIAVDNASKNERWIGACISPSDRDLRLDRLHQLLLQRIWIVALEVSKTASGRQYQHLGTQYQTGAASFGWETVGSHPNRRLGGRPAAAVVTPDVHAVPREHARVLATVVTHRARASKTVERPSRETREAGPAATQSRSSTDWVLPTLVALIGMALLALLLSAGAALPGVGTVRTRLGSRGLSSSRIDLGGERSAAPPRGRGISYRD
jgi:hypothetical protein